MPIPRAAELQQLTADNPFSSDLPPFSEAALALSSFLRGQGAPHTVMWVTREQLTSHGTRIWARLRNPDDRLRIAESMYRVGKCRGLGVAMCALCGVGDATACYVWAPRDEVEAQYAMQPRSLKCQVPVPLVTAVRVDSAVRWRLLRLLNHLRRSRYGDTAVCRVPSSVAATLQ